MPCLSNGKGKETGINEKSSLINLRTLKNLENNEAAVPILILYTTHTVHFIKPSHYNTFMHTQVLLEYLYMYVPVL